jgi:hypothetical protein
MLVTIIVLYTPNVYMYWIILHPLDVQICKLKIEKNSKSICLTIKKKKMLTSQICIPVGDSP